MSKRRKIRDLWIAVTRDELRQIVALADSAEELGRICGVSQTTIYSTIERGGLDCMFERVHYDEVLPFQPMIVQAPLPKNYGRKRPASLPPEVANEHRRAYQRKNSRKRYYANLEESRKKARERARAKKAAQKAQEGTANV